MNMRRRSYYLSHPEHHHQNLDLSEIQWRVGRIRFSDDQPWCLLFGISYLIVEILGSFSLAFDFPRRINI
jgi:hypothetical protein